MVLTRYPFSYAIPTTLSNISPGDCAGRTSVASAFFKVVKTERNYDDRIPAEYKLNLSNSKLKDLLSKIRLIECCGYGPHWVTSVIATINL